MKTYGNFYVIEVIYGEGSYLAFLGITWANHSMAVINFKKRVMTFENQYIRVIAPMDPNEGRRYVELVKDEVVRGWDHAYNISKDYIHLNADGEFGWCISSSASSNFDDALENWKNQMHELSIRKCGLISRNRYC